MKPGDFTLWLYPTPWASLSPARYNDYTDVYKKWFGRNPPPQRLRRRSEVTDSRGLRSRSPPAFFARSSPRTTSCRPRSRHRQDRPVLAEGLYMTLELSVLAILLGALGDQWC